MAVGSSGSGGWLGGLLMGAEQGGTALFDGRMHTALGPYCLLTAAQPS